jgi:hypothetical protein
LFVYYYLRIKKGVHYIVSKIIWLNAQYTMINPELLVIIVSYIMIIIAIIGCIIQQNIKLDRDTLYLEDMHINLATLKIENEPLININDDDALSFDFIM